MEHLYLNQLKCSCLPCRQDRVRQWVGKLLDAGIPADNIMMEINQYGGKVIIYSGNEDITEQDNYKRRWHDNVLYGSRWY